MEPGDLPGILAAADAVHPGYPESEAVFAERLALCPEGCLVLADAEGVSGYLVSHPWRGLPPALDTLLGSLPDNPEFWYIHDIALLPRMRGQGAASAALSAIAVRAQRADFMRMALVAIGGTLPFWQRQGFAVVDNPALAAKLRSYDADARFMERQIAPLKPKT